jgi:hypothetical protein
VGRPIVSVTSASTEAKITPQVAVAAAPSSPPNPLSAGASHIDVCGLGRVAFDPHEDPDGMQAVARSAQPLQSRFVGRLKASADPRARAIGLVLDDHEATAAAMAEVKNGVAKLALQSSDPMLYSFALSRCMGISDGACGELSYETWAQLEPDNAAPWIMVANRARMRRDAVAEAAAFKRAAAAQNYDSYVMAPMVMAEPAIPQDATSWQREYLYIQEMGVVATWAIPINQSTKYCEQFAAADADVQRQCSAVARLVLSKGTSLVDLALGSAIGKRAGWPEKQLASLRYEREALLAVAVNLDPTLQHWSCEAVEKFAAFPKDVTQLGEVGAARQRLNQSGKSPNELKQERDEKMKRLIDEASERAKEDSANAPAT